LEIEPGAIHFMGPVVEDSLGLSNAVTDDLEQNRLRLRVLVGEPV